jgi:hypothetical protein
MPKLCFKTRVAGNTVQLVRHVYSPAHKRSSTLTLGTLSTRADPDDYLANLRLRPGVSLTEEDHRAISQWLMRNGDAQAARYRAAQVARIRANLHEELAADAAAAAANASATMAPPVVSDSFGQARDAIHVLIQALPRMAQSVTDQGASPWLVLRPAYLALVSDWDSLLKAAQAAGIAKQYKRGSPAAVGIPPNQEDPVVE